MYYKYNIDCLIDILAPGAARSLFRSVTSQITLINVLYFLGALIIIGAMTLFMTVGWGKRVCARACVLFCVH